KRIASKRRLPAKAKQPIGKFHACGDTSSERVRNGTEPWLLSQLCKQTIHRIHESDRFSIANVEYLTAHREGCSDTANHCLNHIIDIRQIDYSAASVDKRDSTVLIQPHQTRK